MPHAATGPPPRRPSWLRAGAWVGATVLLSALCLSYLLVTTDWFLSAPLQPLITTWPQAIALLLVACTPAIAIAGAVVVGGRGSGHPPRWVRVLLALLVIVNLIVAISVVLDASRPAATGNRDVEEVIP